MDSVPARLIPRMLATMVGWCMLVACDPEGTSGPAAGPAAVEGARLVRLVDTSRVGHEGEPVDLAAEPTRASGEVLLEVSSADLDPSGADWWTPEHLEAEDDAAPSEGTRIHALDLQGVRDLLLTLSVELDSRQAAEEDGANLGGALAWIETEEPVRGASEVTRTLWRSRRPVPVAGGEPGRVTLRKAVRLDPKSAQIVLVLDGKLRGQSFRLTVQELRGDERGALTRATRKTWPGASVAASRDKVGVSYVAEVLLAATPSELTYPLPAIERGTLSFSTGVLRAECGRGETGVTFRIELHRGTEQTALFEETLDWPRQPERQGPYFHHVPLTEVREGDRLVLTTVATDPAAEDPVVLAAWGHPVIDTGGPDANRPGLVLVSLDTLRADRLGCLDSDLGLTPNLDALAAESLCFTRASAHISFTLPSHASMFSGQYPSIHGVKTPGMTRDTGVTRWLAEVAREHGYRTAAFTGGGQLNPVFEIDGGFEVYEYRDAINRGDYRDLEAWLAGVGDTPCLLFLHTYAAHHYEPPEDSLQAVHPECDSELHERRSLRDYMLLARQAGFSDADREHVIGVYNASVHHADRRFGELIGLLDQYGVLERRPLMMVSDHGEGFWEHGQVGHGFMMPFEEQVHVPLMIRPAGGGEARTCDTVVELIDVLPTVLDFLGLPSPDLIQGRSLTPFLAGQGRERASAYAENPSGKAASLRTDRWKALFRVSDAEPDGALYVFDLEADPGESEPLAGDHPYVAEATRAFEERHGRIRELARRLAVRERAGVLDAEALRELEAVGYVDFGGSDE